MSAKLLGVSFQAGSIKRSLPPCNLVFQPSQLRVLALFQSPCPIHEACWIVTSAIFENIGPLGSLIIVVWWEHIKKKRLEAPAEKLWAFESANCSTKTLSHLKSTGPKMSKVLNVSGITYFLFVQGTWDMSPFVKHYLWISIPHKKIWDQDGSSDSSCSYVQDDGNGRFLILDTQRSSRGKPQTDHPRKSFGPWAHQPAGLIEDGQLPPTHYHFHQPNNTQTPTESAVRNVLRPPRARADIETAKTAILRNVTWAFSVAAAQ